MTTVDQFKPAQAAVFAEAKRRLEKRSWFRGVCLDNFPDEEECILNFEESVGEVAHETSFWDDPDYWGLDRCVAPARPMNTFVS